MKQKISAQKSIPWIISVILMIIIFMISGTSADRIGSTIDFIRNVLNMEPGDTPTSQPFITIDWLKVGHFFGYSLLGSSLYFSYSQKSVRPLLYVFLTVFVYACTDEYHQTFIPGRSGSASDVLLDVASASLVALIVDYKKSGNVKHLMDY